jgi:chromosomal replication initiation ATPase DnaA
MRNLETIKDIVNEFYNLDISVKGRTMDLSKARRVYMYLARKHTKQPLQNIAKSVNLKNHATVIHGVKCVNNDLCYDKEVQGEIRKLNAKMNHIITPNFQLESVFRTEKYIEKIYRKYI